MDPKIQKARNASEMRRRSYWPALSKTDTNFVLKRPHRFHRNGRKNFTNYMYKELPLFGFNSKKNQWEAPLTLEAWQQVVDKFTLAKELQVRLSEEAKTWADCLEAARRAKECHAKAGGEQTYYAGKNAAWYLAQASKVRKGSSLYRLYMRRYEECKEQTS